MSRPIIFSISYPSKSMKTAIPPPKPPRPKKEQGNFYIKVTTYETTTDKQIKRYTGFGQDSDIIPKTVEYCISNLAKGTVCEPPIVLTCSDTFLQIA